MDVLIVESQPELGEVWKRHLERSGMIVTHVGDQEQAIAHLTTQCVEIIILDLVLEDGSALAISDFASYRCPNTQVIFVQIRRSFPTVQFSPMPRMPVLFCKAIRRQKIWRRWLNTMRVMMCLKLQRL